MRTLILSALAFAAFAGPAAAATFDTGCIQRLTTPERRVAFAEALRKKGLEVDPDVKDSDEAYLRSCGVNSGNTGEAGRYLAAWQLYVGTALILEQDYRVAPAALDRAWLDLSAEDRAHVAAVAAMMGVKDPSEAERDRFIAIARRMEAALGTPSQAFQMVFAYAIARSYVETYTD